MLIAAPPPASRASPRTEIGVRVELSCDSNRLSRTTRAGAIISFGYDTLNRLCTKTIATTPTACGGTPGLALTTFYGYDLLGRLTAVNDNSAAITSPSGSAAYTTTYS